MSLDDCQVKTTFKTHGFFKSNPNIWFQQLECHFIINNISNEKSKFLRLITALEPEILAEISDLIIDDNYSYTELKTKIINRFSINTEKRIDLVLDSLVLADKKPSQFLREIRQHSNGNFSELAIKRIFIKKLPLNLQILLSTNTNSLDEISILADNFMELSQNNNHNINSLMSTSSPSTNSQNSMSTTKQDSNNFRSNNNYLNQKHYRSFNKNFNTNTKYQSQTNKSSQQKAKEQSQFNICFYHYKWGAKARKCIQPCNFLALNRHLT